MTDLKDRLLRALAEQENVRRRVERERQEAVRFAASGLARDLLSTLDNLRRAIESVRAEKAADETVQRIARGRGRDRAWDARCAREARHPPDRRSRTVVRSRAPRGGLPSNDAEHPAGTVAEVLQPGYLHHDRLLRPAMVGVATGRDGPTGEDANNRHQEAPRVDRRD